MVAVRPCLGECCGMYVTVYSRVTRVGCRGAERVNLVVFGYDCRLRGCDGRYFAQTGLRAPLGAPEGAEGMLRSSGVVQ